MSSVVVLRPFYVLLASAGRSAKQGRVRTSGKTLYARSWASGATPTNLCERRPSEPDQALAPTMRGSTAYPLPFPPTMPATCVPCPS